LREAILILHRKIDSERKCVCGSELDYVGGDWVCRLQHRTKEDSVVRVELDGRKIIKSVLLRDPTGKREKIIVKYNKEKEERWK